MTSPVSRLTQPLSPESARRIRLHLLLLPVYGWILVVWTAYAIDISPAGHLDRSGHVKGHDFVHFYVLGQIADEGVAADLYDFDAQAARTDRLVPEYPDRFIPLHGPQVSVLFGPLAKLSYEAAVAVWLTLTAALYGLCCALLWRTLRVLRPYRWLALVGAVGFPPFYMLMANGQTTVIALVLVTAAYFALRAHRPFLAGLALGSLFYKPSLGLALVCVLFYGRELWMIAGAVIAVAFQIGVAWVAYGAGPIVRYFHVATHLGDVTPLLEPQPLQMQSLRAFFSILLPWPTVAMGAYVIAALVVLAIAAVVWRRATSLDVRYSVLLLATVLVDPHVNAYDLVLITPVFFLAVAWALERRIAGAMFWIACYLSYVLPALEFVPRITHVQLSVMALVGFMLVLARAGVPGERNSVAA